MTTTPKKVHPKVQARIVASLRHQLGWDVGQTHNLTIEEWRKRRDDSIAMGVVVPAEMLKI